MRWKKYLPMMLILILAAALRVAALLKYGDFWDDEMFSFIYSQKAWPKGLEYWLWETNPPLHLLTLKIWLYIFPATEFFTRLPSVIAGVGAVYITYRFGRDIYNESTGLLAAFYLAIHPYHIFWSATARVYSILLLLTVWSAWLFYRLYFTDNQTRRTRTIFAIINFFLIFSHLSSLFFFAGQFIFLLIAREKKRTLDWIKINLIPFTAGILWILCSFWIKSGNDLSKAWFLNIHHSWQTYMNPFINLMAGQLEITIGTALSTCLAALIGITIYTESRRGQTQIILLFLLIFMPMLVAFALGVWHIKFFVCVLPLFAIITAFVLITRFSRLRIAPILILFVCGAGFINLWRTLPLNNWVKIHKYAEQNRAGRTALVYNNDILKNQIDRYLKKLSMPVIALNLYPELSYDDMVVKKNYIYNKMSDNKKNEWYEKTELNEFQTVILLHGEYNYMTRLDDILRERGWTLSKGPEQARLCGKYSLSVYEKNIGN